MKNNAAEHCDDKFLPFQAPNRGIERKENSRDFGVRTTRGKTNSQLAQLAGKELSLFQGTGSATTGNSTGLKLELQQFNLQLVNVTCTIN